MNDDVSVVSAAEETATEDNVSVVQPEPAKEPEQKNEAPKAPAEEKKGAEEKPEAPVVPEKYEFSFPEGVTADDEAVEGVTSILKELKCDNATAQKLLDMHCAQLQKFVAAQNKAADEERGRWLKALKNDPDIGGQSLKENLSYGSKLLQKYGDKDLTDLLVNTGLDRHPAVAKFLVKVGKEFAEDHWADSGRHGNAVKSADDVAKILFDKTL